MHTIKLQLANLKQEPPIRTNPAEKVYTSKMNKKLNSYLRANRFPRSLSGFISAIGQESMVPRSATKLINLLGKNNFDLGDKWISILLQEVVSDPPTPTVSCGLVFSDRHSTL